MRRAARQTVVHGSSSTGAACRTPRAWRRSPRTTARLAAEIHVRVDARVHVEPERFENLGRGPAESIPARLVDARDNVQVLDDGGAQVRDLVVLEIVAEIAGVARLPAHVLDVRRVDPRMQVRACALAAQTQTLPPRDRRRRRRHGESRVRRRAPYGVSTLWSRDCVMASRRTRSARRGGPSNSSSVSTMTNSCGPRGGQRHRPENGETGAGATSA